jgi:hypothetical protein
MDQPSQSKIENQAVAQTPVETVPTPLEFEHECNSCTTVFQSDTITFKISFGNLLVASPTFGGEPNIASCGDLLIPS